MCFYFVMERNERPVAMKSHARLGLLVGTLLLAGCGARQPAPSARQPIDFFEIAKLMEITDPQTELVRTEFRLLERTEVGADLWLSQEQSNAVRSVYGTPWDQVPGSSEFLAQQKAAKQEASLTKEQRIYLNQASSRGRGRIIAQFRTQQLQAILLPRQLERLGQLVLQTRGPLMLVVDTNLPVGLKLSPEQMKRIRDVVRQADEKIPPLLQRFGRGFWADPSANEMQETRIREMNALIPRLRRMIRVRDKSILQILTLEQNDQFEARQGTLLPLEWDPWDFMREPFEKKNS
jgi:hypothetical protein